ncbi:hypothetical protein ACRALDRAFT_210520 [Sodiomyces alcalophilus JCM 7366]|uniref:uncharacterized protein n=1 Tax=Sodiomyces alcalophilus JCM 7366 TaxID=591952 RepID=UPI0039B53A76
MQSSAGSFEPSGEEFTVDTQSRAMPLFGRRTINCVDPPHYFLTARLEMGYFQPGLRTAPKIVVVRRKAVRTKMQLSVSRTKESGPFNSSSRHGLTDTRLSCATPRRPDEPIASGPNNPGQGDRFIFQRAFFDSPRRLLDRSVRLATSASNYRDSRIPTRGTSASPDIQQAGSTT